MAKVTDQHGGESDQKVFAANTNPSQQQSPEFGMCYRDEEVVRGCVPGTPQWPVLQPDPELPT